MLRKKRNDEAWSFEEMLPEQFALQNSEGIFIPIIVHDTNIPYTLSLACEVYHRRKLSENVVKSTKSEFVQGHRKPMFSDETKKEIAYKYTYFNTSKSELARQYKCSEKTIRNIIKQAYFNTH